VKNPPAQRFVTPQSAPNAKTKVPCVCVNESGTDATRASVAMNQYQNRFAHFPRLLHDVFEDLAIDNLAWMVCVKINFHVFPRLCGVLPLVGRVT
jgi:hypothetical protein